MSLLKLVGDLNRLRGQGKNLSSTVGSLRNRGQRSDWCEEYAAERDGWDPSSVDLLAALRDGAWCGAPLADPRTRLRSSAAVRCIGVDEVVQITDASLYRMKMTGSGFGQHPTWVGGSICVVMLVDRRASGLSSISAICTPLLPTTERLSTTVLGNGPMPVLSGETNEHHVALPELKERSEFQMYSSASPAVDSMTGIWLSLAERLEGWRGHLRFQASSSEGVFLAWDWLRGDRSQWSSQADKTVAVLRSVRDHMLNPNG